MRTKRERAERKEKIFEVYLKYTTNEPIPQDKKQQRLPNGNRCLCIS
jgi:hypothetical protein